jgi:hypothetical protein
MVRRSAILIAVGSLTVLPSCATAPPTVPEIQTTYDIEAQRLREARDEMIRQCNGDQVCIQKARDWYQDHLTELQAIRQDAIREMFPNWPDIKGLIPMFGSVGSLSIDSTPLGSGAVPTQVISIGIEGNDEGGGVEGIASPTPASNKWQSSIDLSGSIQLSGTRSINATIKGSLALSGTTGADGTRSADVYSGSIVASVVGVADMTTLTVTKDARNRLVVGANGTGTLTLVVTREVSDRAWNALTPHYMQVKFPVTRSADDRIHVSMSGVTISQMMGRQPFAITDYNNDGTRDHATDYPVLLLEHAQHVARADINEDGVWNQADLDVWGNLFQADLETE